MRQRLFSIQRHPLQVYFDEAFVFHVSQFPGDSRAVGTEIVSQLGPGQGDGEGLAAGLLRLE